MKKTFGSMALLFLSLSMYGQTESSTAEVQTQALAALHLIKNVKDFAKFWHDRTPGFDKRLPGYVYTLNGKEVSVQQSESGMRQYRMDQCTFDEFEVSFVGAFPSRVVLTYRMYSDLFDLGKGKPRVFSVFARETYEYVSSEWRILKVEAVTAK